MENEDKIMSLLTIAEDQQAAVKQQIEASQQREKEQYQAFTTMFHRMVDEHNELHARYQRNLEKQSSRFSQLLDKKAWFVSIAAPVVCGLFIVAAFLLYLQSVRDELSSAEYALKDLKAFHADLSRCDWADKSYPCIRVRTDWQSYGPDRNYLIIDPK